MNRVIDAQAEAAIDQLCKAARAVLSEIYEFGKPVSSERLDWLELSIAARGAATVPPGYYSERAT